MLFLLPPATMEGKRVAPSHHPIMCATLAASARRNGASVAVLDAALAGLDPSSCADWVSAWEPEWVGIVPCEYRRELPLDTSLEFVRALRQRGFSGEAGLLNSARGSLPPRQAVERGDVDFSAFGDSEPAVEAFALGREEPSPGVLWRRGGYLSEDPSDPEVDWHGLPVPSWDLFRFGSYRPSAHRYRKRPTFPVFASRSCPYGCDFCPQSLFNPSQKHAVRPPKKVFEEIMELVERYGARDIEFYDPTFGIRREETLALCGMLRAAGNPVTWSCYTRCDLVDGPLLSAMASAGCHTILFGVESGDGEVLGRTRKELLHDDVHSAFSLCRESGIRTIASFIIGLPGETPGSLHRTLQFARQLDPSFAQFHLARAFFDHEEWSSMGRTEEGWDVTAASVNGRAYTPDGFTQAGLQRWLLRAYLSFYARPSKLLQIAKGLDGQEDLRRTLSGMRQVGTHVLGLG
jgi:anaerobic magnesium-protoporphyrin IX monomethyl ester cyclase